MIAVVVVQASASIVGFVGDASSAIETRIVSARIDGQFASFSAVAGTAEAEKVVSFARLTGSSILTGIGQTDIGPFLFTPLTPSKRWTKALESTSVADESSFTEALGNAATAKTARIRIADILLDLTPVPGKLSGAVASHNLLQFRRVEDCISIFNR